MAMRLNVRTATVDELVVAYAKAANVHGEATVAGDRKKATRGGPLVDSPRSLLCSVEADCR